MLCARLMVRSKYTILGIPPEIFSPRVSAAFDAIVHATNGLYIMINHCVSLESWWYSFLWNKGQYLGSLYGKQTPCLSSATKYSSAQDAGNERSLQHWYQLPISEDLLGLDISIEAGCAWLTVVVKEIAMPEASAVTIVEVPELEDISEDSMKTHAHPFPHFHSDGLVQLAYGPPVFIVHFKCFPLCV